MPHGQRACFVPPNGWWQLAAVGGTSVAVLAEATAACCGHIHTTSVLLFVPLLQHGVEFLPICLCAALAEEIFLLLSVKVLIFCGTYPPPLQQVGRGSGGFEQCWEEDKGRSQSHCMKEQTGVWEISCTQRASSGMAKEANLPLEIRVRSVCLLWVRYLRDLLRPCEGCPLLPC